MISLVTHPVLLARQLKGNSVIPLKTFQCKLFPVRSNLHLWVSAALEQHITVTRVFEALNLDGDSASSVVRVLFRLHLQHEAVSSALYTCSAFICSSPTLQIHSHMH